MSADGRFVAFVSSASNLVAGDRNKRGDLFVYDRMSGKMQRSDVGHYLIAEYGVTLSPDLRFVAFTDARPGSDCYDAFVYDRSTGKTEQVDLNRKGAPGAPAGNCAWGNVALSPDGRFVAFSSASPDLVAGGAPTAHTQCPDDFMGCSGTDVFVRDRKTGTTERVSVSSSGGRANGDSFVSGISADGRLVYFSSKATNLTADGKSGQFVRDRLTKTTRRLPTSFSPEARFAAFSVKYDAGDGRLPAAELYVYERATGKRTLVHVTKRGERANARIKPVSISADGRYVVFLSDATNLDAPSAHATCPSPGGRGYDEEGQSFAASPGARYLCSDLYVTDRTSGKTELVTANANGKPAGHSSVVDSQPAFISADGRYVAFTSTAKNLVPGRDTNRDPDVFLRDLRAHTTTLISAAAR